MGKILLMSLADSDRIKKSLKAVNSIPSKKVYFFTWIDVWEKMPDMQIARATGFCFEYLQKIYVCGGFTSEFKRSKKIEVWDL